MFAKVYILLSLAVVLRLRSWIARLTQGCDCRMSITESSLNTAPSLVFKLGSNQNLNAIKYGIKPSLVVSSLSQER